MHDYVTDCGFAPLVSFEIRVPADFSLNNGSRKLVANWSDRITDANFRSGLKLGRRYRAEICSLVLPSSNSRMLAAGLMPAIKKTGALGGGALGGAIVASRHSDQLEKVERLYLLCPDEFENLWNGVSSSPYTGFPSHINHCPLQGKQSSFIHIPRIVRSTPNFDLGLDYYHRNDLSTQQVLLFRPI